MFGRTSLALCAILITVVTPLAALTPGTDVLVPAVAVVADWRTDLYIFNHGTQSAAVDVELLVRGQANPSPESQSLTLSPGQAAALENVLHDTFGYDSFTGAIRVTADHPVVVNTRIFNLKNGVTFGQGFEGIPRSMAVQAGDSTDIIGLANNTSFRTNLVMMEATGDTSQTAPSAVRVTFRDAQGTDVASRDIELAGFEPFLKNITDSSVFGSSLSSSAYGTLHCEVLRGAVIFAASKVDNDSATGDPTTLAAWSGGEEEEPPVPTGDVYLYSSTGDDDLSPLITEWNSGSTLTEVTMDGYDRVMRVEPGMGWGGISSCIAFQDIGDYQSQYEAIVFKVKSDDLTQIYVKVPEVEIPFPFTGGVDLGNGWYEISAPFAMFTGAVPGSTQVGIHGGWGVGGTFYITDVKLTVAED